MPIDAHSFLPLRPVDFLILLSLVEEDQHGYGLVKQIAERTDGVVELAPGNLYRVIKRLVADGLIAPSARRVVPELEDERRHYYSITALGLRVAALEGHRLQALLATRPARALLRTAGAT
ncbi:MAG TPA: PadR family transcriptional regulator [Gemmatimonadaceae bacterium]